jgi:hypothetical protein
MGLHGRECQYGHTDGRLLGTNLGATSGATFSLFAEWHASAISNYLFAAEKLQIAADLASEFTWD